MRRYAQKRIDFMQGRILRGTNSSKPPGLRPTDDAPCNLCLGVGLSRPFLPLSFAVLPPSLGCSQAVTSPSGEEWWAALKEGEPKLPSS
ncbi:hypothetical protein I5U07_09595 [Stenotrophomonas maltophilia]|nr:hypothetical protein [Stenotrophomonas maltophilia]